MGSADHGTRVSSGSASGRRSNQPDRLMSYGRLTSRAQNSGKKGLINAAPAKQMTTLTPDELPAYPARTAWRIYVRCNSECNELFLAFGDRLYLGHEICKHPILKEVFKFRSPELSSLRIYTLCRGTVRLALTYQQVSGSSDQHGKLTSITRVLDVRTGDVRAIWE